MDSAFERVDSRAPVGRVDGAVGSGEGVSPASFERPPSSRPTGSVAEERPSSPEEAAWGVASEPASEASVSRGRRVIPRSRSELPGVSGHHLDEPLIPVTVQVRGDSGLDKREQFVAEVGTACHPLVVAAPTVVVRSIQPATRESPFQPVEQGLVPDVHSQGDLRLAPVPPKWPSPISTPTRRPSSYSVGTG